MQIMITGKNIDIGDALREHIETRLTDHVTKYFERATQAHVTVEKQKNSFQIECTLHLSTGLTINARGDGGDAYSGFDQSLEHLETRLRRYTRRLKNHHRDRKKPIMVEEAASFVIEPRDEADATGDEQLNPAIIAETTHKISELSVGEAVMKMDVSDLPFVLFKTESSDQVNIVYRREDGNVGWIDPGSLKT